MSFPEVSYPSLVNLVKEQYKDVEIGNIYMIGDNPKSDIKGGNDAGWITILVRTGMFQGKENDLTHPAKYVVNDFREAVDLILKKEGLEGLEVPMRPKL